MKYAIIPDQNNPTNFMGIPIDETLPDYNRLTQTLKQVDVKREGKWVRVWIVVDADHIIASTILAVANFFKT